MLNFYDFIQVCVFTTNHHLDGSVFCLALSGVFDRCKQPECVTSRNVKLRNKQFDRFVYRVLIQVCLIDKPLSNLIFSRLLCPFIDISFDFMYVILFILHHF